MAFDDRISRRIKMSDLRMFLTVVERGSMSKAAATLNISQSAVSKALSELEHTLGVRLLDRTPQGVEPTLYGRALLDRGRTIFEELRRGVQDIEFLVDPSAGEIRIGVAPPLIGFLSAVIEKLWQTFPKMVFDVVERDSSALQHGDLRERRIEFMLGRMATPFDDDTFSSLVLFDDQVRIICGATNPWARRRKIEFTDLADDRWIVPPSSGVAGTRALEIFRAHGLPVPKAAVVANSTKLRDRLLATGHFLAVAPEVELRFSDNRGSLKALPVELRVPPWPIGIVMLKNRTLSGAAKVFIETARQLAKT